MPALAPLPGSCEVDCGVGEERSFRPTDYRVQSRRADVHCIVHTLSQGGAQAQAAQTIRMKNATDESLHSELRLKVFRLAGMLRNIRIILKNVPVLGCCGASA